MLAQHLQSTAGGFSLLAFVKFGMTHESRSQLRRCDAHWRLVPHACGSVPCKILARSASSRGVQNPLFNGPSQMKVISSLADESLDASLAPDGRRGSTTYTWPSR